MKKFNKIISLIICFTFITVFTMPKVSGAENNKEVVYVDGISFEYFVDDSGELNIRSLEDNGKTYLKLNSEGEAEVQLLEDESYEEYKLDIEELTEEEVYVEVNDDEGERVDIYDDIDDILVDEYEGQALAVGTGISMATLLTVTLMVTSAVVVGGVTYYAISTVIEKVKSNNNNKNSYYKAYIQNYVTFIAFYSGKISKNQAASRIKSGNNVYSYSKSMAKSAVNSAGLGIVGPEIHLRKGKFAFYHYHTANRNGAHSLYGMPYTK